MELSSQEGEIPIPINSSLISGGNGHGGHAHIIHHHHPASHNLIIPASSSSPTPQTQIPALNGPISTSPEDHINPPSNVKKMIKYKECLKNHAASMGGNATDGCGEFMPSGEEGTIEALNCSACNCHRNFHRKEIEGEQQQQQQQAAISPFDCYHHNPHFNRVGRKVILGHHKNILAATPEALGYPTATGTLISSRAAAPTPHQMIMSYNMGSLPSESDEQEDGGGVVMAARPTHHHHHHLHHQLAKKRFRTKFTQEQKEKMFNFAEKVGWKIQKQEESVVQQFCQEIGVKRRVLKVWMHNNKHNLAKKNDPPPPSTTTA
ncbi:Zinc-finger homeodomain protein [Melia azedarach]|uniref:Zinc-finger homeodomain protein n=1 Tax=Melia azedarach TaxID=155640 RepID=A0ACC1Y2M4_MELAZ|nr:Zinc-finger homeodomain protein [Melia azedarach]